MGNDKLPQYLSPKERHLIRRDEGMHPEIEPDDEWEDISSGILYGAFVRDGERLINFLDSGRCPVCGEPESLLVVDNPTFLLGADRKNDRLSWMEDRGYGFISHTTDTAKWFVGVATPQAVAEYEDWADRRSELRDLKKRARRVASNKYIDDSMGRGEITHGVLIAAIYELLGAREYDSRDLIGRNVVTKKHLLAIIARLQSVRPVNRDDLHEDDWYKVNEYGVSLGDVEWEMPEWVGQEGGLFDPDDIPSVWEDVDIDTPDL